MTSRNFTTPYVQSWNLNVQRRHRKEATAELGYVGSKGTHLARVYDVNQTDADGNFPNTNYQAMDTLATNAGSLYHALQATLKTRSWRGLSGFANYTWSKTSTTPRRHRVHHRSRPAAGFLQPARRARSLDVRHAAALYRRGQLLGQEPGFGPERLKTGWQLGLIVTAQSGRPILILWISYDNSGRYNHYNQRPDVVPLYRSVALERQDRLPESRSPLAAGRRHFGDLGRNSVFGPKFVNTDFSVEKTTKVTERVKAATARRVLQHLQPSELRAARRQLRLQQLRPVQPDAGRGPGQSRTGRRRTEGDSGGAARSV